MSMVTLSWIVHTGYLPWKPQHNTTNPDLMEATMPDQVQGTIVKTGTGKVIPDDNLIFADITAQTIMIHIEATPGHDIGIIIATPGVAYDAHSPHIEITVINPAVTHHTDLITDHPHIEVLQLTTPEIKADNDHVHPTILKVRFTQLTFTFLQIMRQTTPREEPKSKNRRSTHGLLQL